jgi:hypothetical protein
MPDPFDYNGDELVGVASAFLGLSSFAVLLRFYVRLRITKSFAADDWLMLVSQVTTHDAYYSQFSRLLIPLKIVFILSCTFILVGVHSGLGRHNKSLSQKKEIEALKVKFNSS